MLRHFIRAHWLLFVSLLLLTAVALTAARLWVPTLGNYQQELEAAASDALNRQVRIGKLEATWRGLGPVLKLKKVAIEAPAAERGELLVDEVWIRLDLRHYIAERKVRVYGVDVIGTEIGLTRDTDGRVFINEFDQGATGRDFDIEQFLKMRRLSVNDSVITFTDLQTGEAPHRFSDVTLAMHSDGFEHSLSGYLLLPPELGYRVDIAAQLFGEGANFSAWRGNAYFKGQVLALSDLVRALLPEGTTAQGIADVRMWAEFASARLLSLQGEVDAHSLVVEHSAEGEVHRFSAEATRGRIGWRRIDEGWQLALQDFILTQDGVVSKTGNLSLSGFHSGEAKHLHIVSDQLHLDGIGSLLKVLPGLGAQPRKHLAAMRPGGTVNDLKLSLQYTPGVLNLKHFSSGFSALAIRQSGKYPALSGLSGEIAGTPALGSLSLFGSAVGFHDRELFSAPLTPFELQADFNWQRSGERLELTTGNLQLKNPDMAMRGALGLGLQGGEAPSLFLQLAIDSADVGRIGRYLPAKRMRPKGVSWMQRSLVSGLIENGSVTIDGRLDEFPFDNNEGTLAVSLPVKNAVLDYNRRWSPIVGLAAQVDIDGRSLKVSSRQGSIRSALAREVHVHILDLAKPVLSLNGAMRGPLAGMLEELGSSPLGESYGRIVDLVQTQGAAELELDLDMVLHGKNRSVRAAGRVELQNNELAIEKTDIVLKKINGALQFDDKGIRGEGLTTEYNGRAAQVRVWTGEDKRVTHVRLDGKLGLLQQVIDAKSPLHASIRGDSDWRAELKIAGKPQRGEKTDVSLHLGSMLQGTAVDLPEPFGKDAASARELSVDITRLDYPQKRVRLNYGDSVNGLLTVEADGKGASLDGGSLVFGGGLPDAPAAKRLLISGRLPQVRTSDWKPMLGGDGKRPGPPVEFDIDIADLEVLGHHVFDVSVQMAAAGLVWNIKADGPSVSGDIALTRTGAGLDKAVMTLDRLVLKRGAPAPQQQREASRPDAFPNLQIVAKEFSYDDIALGNFQLSTKKNPDNSLEITRLILSSDLLAARLSGLWQQQEGEQRSNVDLEVTGAQMDSLLKVFGFQESISGGNLTGTMRAAWAGPPWAFSPPQVEGQINVLIENGQLVDLDPGAAGRILGLLSLNNIRRRLVLDFSDLFGEGFSFDRIEGSFVVEGGNAYTSDLFVKGPAAKIDITGRVGLAARDYDQQVTVTPTVKTPFSLAGTLVGGPVVGAAIMVAETLLEGKIEALNKLVRTRYSITGPWSEPEIRKIGEEEIEVTPDGADTAVTDSLK